MVQSSSTTTSLMIPLAGGGVFSTRQLYPFTLGANIGTTITALLAATAISGAGAKLALTIALVHVLFNLFAVVLIYGVPFLRELPVKAVGAGQDWQREQAAGAWLRGGPLLCPARPDDGGRQVTTGAGDALRPSAPALALAQALPVQSHLAARRLALAPGWDKMPLSLPSRHFTT